MKYLIKNQQKLKTRLPTFIHRERLITELKKLMSKKLLFKKKKLQKKKKPKNFDLTYFTISQISVYIILSNLEEYRCEVSIDISVIQISCPPIIFNPYLILVAIVISVVSKLEFLGVEHWQ